MERKNVHNTVLDKNYIVMPASFWYRIMPSGVRNTAIGQEIAGFLADQVDYSDKFLPTNG